MTQVRAPDLEPTPLRLLIADYLALPSAAWSTLPSYPPVYLSTQTEYIPKPRLSKAQKAAQAESLAATSPGAAESGLAALTGKKPVEWDTEGYVKGSGIPGADELFERFLARLSSEPGQVIRCVGTSTLSFGSKGGSGVEN